MKKLFFLTITILSIYALFSFNVTKTNNYNIIRTIDSVEIRQYPALIYASHFSQSGNNSQFRVLANYIFGGNDKNVNLSMFDNSGRLIWTRTKELNSGRDINIETTNLKAGMYYIKVESETVRKTAKLVKK